MSNFDYTSVQGLLNFGRGFAADILGQPFQLYRLNPSSSGNVLDPSNLLINDIRAIVTHNRTVSQIENELLHTNSFMFKMDNTLLQLGDVLVQNDPVYGANTQYAVISFRPLKQVMCERVESLCTIYRPTANRTSGYGGRTSASDLPFVLTNGIFAPVAGGTPAVVPCGVQTIGQIKLQKPEHMPMDVINSWWWIYVPLLPGLDRLRESDYVEVAPVNSAEPAVRYRVNSPYSSPVGSAGQFLLCERATP